MFFCSFFNFLICKKDNIIMYSMSAIKTGLYDVSMVV